MNQPEIRDPERLDLLSASQLEIVAECPGMINLKATIPKEQLEATRSEDDDEWAKRGTRIHDAFETSNTLNLDPEEFKTYMTGLSYSESIKQKWIQDKALDPAKVVEGPRELRVWAYKPYDFPNLLGSGKLDRHWVYQDADRCCLLIQDYKAGFNPNLPPSNRSWQLAFQAVLLWKEEYDKVTDARVAYVKAKDKCESGDFCDYGEMDLKYRWDAIVFAGWMSTQPDAPRHAGKHCRWCPAKAFCPEAAAYCLLPVVMAKGVMEGKKPVQSVDEITPDDLYRLWDGSGTIKAILDAVKARLKSFPAEELAKIGIREGAGRKTMEWFNTKGAFELLRDKEAWPEEAIWNALEFKLGRLVEVAAKLSGVDEDEASKMVKELLQEFYTMKEGEKILRHAK